MNRYLKVQCWFKGVDFRKEEAQNDILHTVWDTIDLGEDPSNKNLSVAFPPKGEEPFDIFILRGSEPVVHAAISGIIKEFMDSFLAGNLEFGVEGRV